MVLEKVSNKSRIRMATFFCFAFMVAYALSFGMYSTILPSIKEGYGLNYSQSSYLGVMDSVGMAIAMVFTLLFADRIKKPTLLVVCGILFGGVMLFMGQMPVFLMFLALRLVFGMVTAIVDNICAAYLSDLYGDNRARIMAVLHVLYGVGAVIGPVYASIMLTRGGGWSAAYTYNGLATLALGVLFLVLLLVMKPPQPIGEAAAEQEARAKKIPYGKILTSRAMIIICICNFFLTGFQYFTTWLVTYLDDLDPVTYTVQVGSTLMVLYSIGMIISRMVYAAGAKRIKPHVYIGGASLLTAGVALAGILLGVKEVWFVVAFLIGLISGSNYTAKFVIACDEFPDYSATAISMVAVAGALGTMFFSWLIGVVADKTSYTTAMFLPIISLVLAAATMFIGYRKSKNSESV